ncbi:NAD(P)/FAD-dependent oxidoreductase [Knoellia sp. CPCC 206453]|uniref:NAD(P)/FAD-dependent oxidoreductase n=1 Tax=Knoellia pratensis TaxID=3404796 RepID=UPI00360D658F
MRDLIVAGGGPIGLSTAMYAVRAGLDVGVREPRAGVIDKACGEGLMPGAVAALRDLDVDLDGHPITGIRYVDGTRSAQARFRHGQGLGVRRTVLHDALTSRAEAVGIVPEQRPVREVLERGDHLLVDGEPTRYLIAADGLHSPVRRLLDLSGPPSRLRRYGQRCHVEMEPWTSCVEVHWACVGEAYVTPVGAREVGIAVLTTERRSWDDLLTDFPLLVRRLEGRSHSRPLGAGPLRQRSRQRVRGRVLLVGDASGYVDALTGEGIALGLAQARAAVEAIADDRPARYAGEWRRLGWRHDLLTHGLVSATSLSPVRHRIVHAAAVLPGVFDAAVNQLARPA